MTLFPRCSGILLHPTSFPGRYGIGDLGEWAYRFVDWLEETGQSVWQVLPLGPTSYGDSPYQTLSAFAGNPNLISLDKLIGDGWLTDDDLADAPDFPVDRVDYGWVIDYHNQKLTLAYERFAASGTPEQRLAFEAWCGWNGRKARRYVTTPRSRRRARSTPNASASIVSAIGFSTSSGMS